MPNLVPFEPQDWDAPVVVTDVRATSSESLPSGGGPFETSEDVYVHFAIQNESLGPVEERFEVAIKLDDEIVWSRRISGLGPQETMTRLNTAIRVEDEGRHTVALVIDFEDDVTESDEADNRFSVTLVWQGPTPGPGTPTVTPAPNPSEVTQLGRVDGILWGTAVIYEECRPSAIMGHVRGVENPRV